MSSELPTDDAGPDRREHERTAGALVVRMRFPRIEDFRYRYTRDCSRGGVFIQTVKPKPIGARVVLVLEPLGREAVSIRGEVVTSLGPDVAVARQLQPGMGIRFLDLDGEKRQVIERILEEWQAAGGAPPPPPASPSAAAGSAPVAVAAPTPATVSAAPVPTVAPSTTPKPVEGDDLATLEADAKALLARLEACDYYQLLDTPRDASSGELRRAFIGLTKRFHPDRYFRRAPPRLCQDLEDIYNQLTQAYETLLDRDKRAAYDVAIGNLDGNKNGVTAHDMARLAGEERRRKTAPGRLSRAEQLVAQANQEAAAGQTSKAVANLRLALAFDPENQGIKARLDELRTKR